MLEYAAGVFARRPMKALAYGPTIGAWEREGGTTLDTALKVAETLAILLGRSGSDVLNYIAWG